MSAAVFGALAGSALSSMFSKSAQDDMNAYNEDMYLKYKLPTSQAKNLRAAGINPAFAISNIASGAVESPTQTSPADTSGTSALTSALPTAVLQDEQAALARQQARNQEIKNGFEQTRQLLELNKMSEEVNGLKYDNYVKNGSKDLQISILNQQNKQMYTKTYVDNLTAVGSEWDVATKAMFAKIGQPLQFEKLRNDIASTSANLAYQLKVNKWYDRFSSAQINSLYSSAAAALIQAHAAETNSYINAYLAPGQDQLNKGSAFNQRQQGYSNQWNTIKDKKLFPLVKQSLKLGVDIQKQDLFNKSNHYDQPLWNTVGGAAWDINQHSGSWFSSGLSKIGAGAAAYNANVKKSTAEVKARQKAKEKYEAKKRAENNK